jgi:hypothetical protein
MQLMLTSFGIMDRDFIPTTEKSMFYRMPPVDMHDKYEPSKILSPNYATLILCNNIVFDEISFLYLIENPHKQYTQMADTMKLLHKEGFVKLVNFKDILKQNEPLHKKMLANDLNILDCWIQPLKESLKIWDSFIHKSNIMDKSHLNNKALTTKYKNQAYRNMHVLKSHIVSNHISHGMNIRNIIDKEIREANSTKGKAHFDMTNLINQEIRDIYEPVSHFKLIDEMSFRMEQPHTPDGEPTLFINGLKPLIKEYLSYINANIILSNELGIGFHDWADFYPFYKLKFLSVGKDVLEERKTIESQKLFEVSFPEFKISDNKSFLKVITDKRIQNLRDLVNKAVKGELSFDQEFARNTFKEVLGVEMNTKRQLKMIARLTSPIKLIPKYGRPAHKAINWAIGTPLEKKLKKKYRWFYLLSDITENI